MTPKEDLIDWVAHNLDNSLKNEIGITRDEILEHNEGIKPWVLDNILEDLRDRIKTGISNVIDTYEENSE